MSVLQPRSRINRRTPSSTLEAMESRRLFSGGVAVDLQALAARPHDGGSILVRFKDGAADQVRGPEVLSGTAVGAAVGLDTSLREVRLGGGVSVAAALDRYASNPLVEFAEPNWLYTPQAVSNDPYYTNGSLWGMYGDDTSVTPDNSKDVNPFGSQANEAWAAGNTGSATVYVGVIDEGIQFTHPDLDANVWTNPYDPVDGVDNDNNGYVDDIHGWDFARNDNTIYDGGKSGSQDKHGTHVTGTITAEGGNGSGVAGVAWNVRYISGKFLGPNGGSTANAIRAVDYMTNLKVAHGMNIVATNNSWGGGGFSQGLLDAIRRAAAQGILFVAAAGNSGANTDTSPSYPAGYDVENVISVAAIDSAGNLASFSNYGAKSVDLGAPGVGIYSTLPSNKYGSYSGTSMAAPHVTGAAAVYAAAHPGATAQDIRNALLTRATSTASLAGKTVTGGRLNVFDSLAVPTAAESLAQSTTTDGTATGDSTATLSGGLFSSARIRPDEGGVWALVNEQAA